MKTDNLIAAVVIIVCTLIVILIGSLIGYHDGMRDGIKKGQTEIYQEAERRGYVELWNAPGGDTAYRWKEDN